MNKKEFERIVKDNRIINDNNEIVTLKTKEEFIDNLLQNEDISIIKNSLISFQALNNDNDKDNYCILNRYIKAIEGLEQAKSIEIFYIKDNTEKDYDKLEELKIRYIKTLVNWLFEE